MKKIRINELARELEVKAHEILELLPELGVSEKKTHSSSIDEDVAIKLRQHYGQDVPDYVHDPNADDSAGEHEEAHGEEGHETPPAAAAIPVAPLQPPPGPAPARPPRAARPIHPPVGAHPPAKPPEQHVPRGAPAAPAPHAPHPAPAAY